MAKKIRYAGEVFEGYNKPKKTPGGKKKFAVLIPSPVEREAYLSEFCQRNNIIFNLI